MNILEYNFLENQNYQPKKHPRIKRKCINDTPFQFFVSKDYFSGVGKSAWLLWIIVAVLLQMITFIVIYVKLTITEFQKQQIVHQEQARLLDQEDGKPLQYGGGMMYR